MKRVAIVEDQTAVRQMLSQIIGSIDGFEVVAEIGDGQQAVQGCIDIQPDVIVLDIMLPGLNGSEVLSRVMKRLKGVRILIFTGHQNPAMVRDLLQKGAHGFVEKTATLDELRKGIITVAEGGSYFGPDIASLLRDAVLHPQDDDSPSLSQLTAREREVLQLIAESYSSKQIAEKLNLSLKTAENHRTNLMKKLKLHDIAGMTRFAIQQGMVDPNLRVAHRMRPGKKNRIGRPSAEDVEVIPVNEQS